jgi:hypothetical protein
MHRIPIIYQKKKVLNNVRHFGNHKLFRSFKRPPSSNKHKELFIEMSSITNEVAKTHLEIEFTRSSCFYTKKTFKVFKKRRKKIYGNM